MPLRGLLDGKDILAPLFSEDEWEEMRESVRSGAIEIGLPCCSTQAFLRVSKLGTKHFYHKRRSECEWKSESYQHLKAKQDILKGCIDAGFDAATEVSGGDWRADVLATGKHIQIAFEVQWSRQTLAETEIRQNGYKQDGITGVWFFRYPPSGQFPATRDFPIFQLMVNDADSFSVSFGFYHQLDLSKFTEELLGGRIKLCDKLRSMSAQKIGIVFFEETCWRCKKPSHVFFLRYPYVSRCGAVMHELEGGLWGSAKLEYQPEVLQAVAKFCESPEGRHLRVGNIKMRRSGTTKSSYMSFGCYWCDVLFGDWHYSRRVMEQRAPLDYPDEDVEPESTIVATATEEVFVRRPPVVEGLHWCYSTGRSFCE